MRIPLATRLVEKDGLNYLPFWLPNDVLLSEMHISCITEVTLDPSATYVQVYHYEKATDYKEDASGNPAGNPLIIWKGWIKSPAYNKKVKIPINYIIDPDSNGQFVIVFDIKSLNTAIFTADVIYQDKINTSTSNYIAEDNQGNYLLTFNAKITAVGDSFVRIAPKYGEYFELLSYFINFLGVPAARNYEIDINRTKPIIYSIVSNDKIYLDKKISGIKFDSSLDVLQFRGINLPVDAQVITEIRMRTRSGNKVDVTGINCTLLSERHLIF